jgi:hypothetical protein
MLIHDILLLKHRGGWYWVVVRSCGLMRDVLLFDPAIVAPRLAWLVEAVAFGGAGWGWWDVGWQFMGSLRIRMHIHSSFEYVI